MGALIPILLLLANWTAQSASRNWAPPAGGPTAHPANHVKVSASWVQRAHLLTARTGHHLRPLGRLCRQLRRPLHAKRAGRRL